MYKQARSYKESLYNRLRDNEEASEYLRVALEEGIPSFMTALRNVAESRQISAIAEASSLNREHLYRILSSEGNPKVSNLAKILHALGLKLNIEVERPEKPVTPCKVLAWKPRTVVRYAASRSPRTATICSSPSTVRNLGASSDEEPAYFLQEMRA